MLVREISMKRLLGLWGLKSRWITILFFPPLFTLLMACQLYFIVYVVDWPLWNASDCIWLLICLLSIYLFCYYFTHRIFLIPTSCCILVCIWFHTCLELPRKISLDLGSKVRRENLGNWEKVFYSPKMTMNQIQWHCQNIALVSESKWMSKLNKELKVNE